MRITGAFNRILGHNGPCDDRCTCETPWRKTGHPVADLIANEPKIEEWFLREVERRAGESRDSMLQLCEHQRLIGHPRDGDELRRLLVRILGEGRS